MNIQPQTPDLSHLPSVWATSIHHNMLAFLFLLLGLSSLPLRSQTQTDAAPVSESSSSNLVYTISREPLGPAEREAKEAAIKESAKIRNPDPRLVEVLIDNLSFPPCSCPAESDERSGVFLKGVLLRSAPQ